MQIARLLALAPLLAALPACSSAGAPGHLTAQIAEDAGVPSPPEGIAPQPYTAASIRASHPVGTFTTYRITSAGAPPMEQRTDWVESTAEGCVMAASTPPGAGESQRASALWWELRDHASFPADVTQVSRETISVAAGTFDCTRYLVSVPESDGGGTRSFWFDTRTGGSPVLFTQSAGGAEVFRMELLAMNRAPIAPAD
ncbi:MAG: hypothetical protein R3F49_13475 [Planctomycetota bacterium]